MVVDRAVRTDIHTDIHTASQTDLLFHAFADATRRDIVRLVLVDEQSVSALARRYPITFAAVQKHVAVLERAGLVVKRKVGREQLVGGRVDAVQEATRLLDELEAIWRGRLDRFAALLAEPSAEPSVALPATPAERAPR